MKDEMRDIFFIIKGQHAKGVEPSVKDKTTGDVTYIGGYDPYSDDTVEWYQLVDNITFNTICCGSDLDKVLRGVYTTIKHFKGRVKKYVKYVEKSDTKTSRMMVLLKKSIYEEYGEYYEEDIKKMEDLAFSDLRGDTPLMRGKKLMSKVKPNTKVVLEETPVEPTPHGEPTRGEDTPRKTHTKVLPKARTLGLKKIK